MLNDHIYAVGGFDGSCGLNTAEVTVEHGDQDDEEKQTIGNYHNHCNLSKVLDMSVGGTHEWRSIASMSTRRSSVGVGVLQVRLVPRHFANIHCGIIA